MNKRSTSGMNDYGLPGYSSNPKHIDMEKLSHFVCNTKCQQQCGDYGQCWGPCMFDCLYWFTPGQPMGFNPAVFDTTGEPSCYARNDNDSDNSDREGYNGKVTLGSGSTSKPNKTVIIVTIVIVLILITIISILFLKTRKG